MYALSKRYADFTTRKFLFVGAKGNIGNSWKAASELMGFELEQCCPSGYEVENIQSHRNLEEVAAEVIDSEYFAGYGFKRHLLEVQQAIICYLLKQSCIH